MGHAPLHLDSPRLGPTAVLASLGLFGLIAGLAGCSPAEAEPTVQVRLASVGNSCDNPGKKTGADKGNGKKTGHCHDDSGAGSGDDESGDDESGDGEGTGAGGGGSEGSESTPGTGDFSGGLTIVDRDGNPIPFDPEVTQVIVETRLHDWEPALDVSLEAGARPRLDVMLVADNSGGLKRDVDLLKEALSHFARTFMNSGTGDRVGLVRVSTEARTSLPLGNDRTQLLAAVDELYVSNGWTALWDGIRIANQELAAAQLEEQDDGATCFSGAYPVIVAMTDGADNNSAGQENTRYAGDGVDTYFEDLLDLRAGFRRTTVHSVGIGKKVDEPALRELSRVSGGVYRSIDDYHRLVGALRSASARLGSMIPLCFRPAHCSHSEVRVQVSVEHDGEVHDAEFVTALEPSCPTEE